MNPHKPLRKLVVSSLCLAAALLSAQLKCDASPAQQQEQQQSQSQQQPPPPPAPAQNAQPASSPTPQINELPVKRRKVWTNDEVVTLRTPTDNYLAEKEAKQAADAEAAAKEAAIRAAIKSEKDQPLDIKLPATPEETEIMLKNTQEDVQEETVVLEKLHNELLDAPLEQQAGKQKEIDHLTANIEILRRDVKALQEHLQTLRGKSAEKKPPAAPEAPSAPPTPPPPQSLQ
jgi:hypothetical protein